MEQTEQTRTATQHDSIVQSPETELKQLGAYLERIAGRYTAVRIGRLRQYPGSVTQEEVARFLESLSGKYGTTTLEEEMSYVLDDEVDEWVSHHMKMYDAHERERKERESGRPIDIEVTYAELQHVLPALSQFIKRGVEFMFLDAYVSSLLPSGTMDYEDKEVQEIMRQQAIETFDKLYKDIKKFPRILRDFKIELKESNNKKLALKLVVALNITIGNGSIPLPPIPLTLELTPDASDPLGSRLGIKNLMFLINAALKAATMLGEKETMKESDLHDLQEVEKGNLLRFIFDQVLSLDDTPFRVRHILLGSEGVHLSGLAVMEDIPAVELSNDSESGGLCVSVEQLAKSMTELMGVNCRIQALPNSALIGLTANRMPNSKETIIFRLKNDESSRNGVTLELQELPLNQNTDLALSVLEPQQQSKAQEMLEHVKEKQVGLAESTQAVFDVFSDTLLLTIVKMISGRPVQKLKYKDGNLIAS